MTISVNCPRASVASNGSPSLKWSPESFTLDTFVQMVCFSPYLCFIAPRSHSPKAPEIAALKVVLARQKDPSLLFQSTDPPAGTVVTFSRSEWLRLGERERRRHFAMHSIHVVSNEACPVLSGEADACDIPAHANSNHRWDASARNVLEQVTCWSSLGKVLDLTVPRYCHSMLFPSPALSFA